MKVVAEFSDGSTVTAHIHGGTSESLNAPQDDNENHIAGWLGEELGAYRSQPDADDDDFPVGDGYKEESIPLYDEYRGFHIGGRHEGFRPSPRIFSFWTVPVSAAESTRPLQA